ncbi:contractile injection system protein, VgrG/Pvc8 family [Pseudomonas sp. GD03842]|uniref:contractile injection system protein, VgrG/Pvc8 family n=1 Tax=unclassified Pseudomonas TaxID=196821 RepID=UPI000D39D00E|nr:MULTISPECIES: contractile injection system protein, VgrG/Pvc8 family [unclassified Pseudomonas]MDH0746707.1 contractile injection system protein, VgrG/Pvc8 family [Pseudomonas sp. GD03842]RAU39830.1 hypothetical protein DBP26_025760 [Pseudomonas sp. RIT 409]RAU53474.1 hypothetical protein DBY65_014750 [Pseudomonas sp. RIT 412]
MSSPPQVMPLRLEVDRPRHSFEVVACERSEEADQPYLYTLDITHPDSHLDTHELLFSAGWLHGSEAESGIHGHVHSIMRMASRAASSNLLHSGPSRYRITFGPRLGLMAWRYNQRVFQGLDARQIIQQVLSEHGIQARGLLWRRKQACQKRDYCAQYRESDLQLVQRLCAEEGMRYHFLHARHRHVVVFTDESPLDAAECAESREVDAPVVSLTGACMHRASLVGGLFESVQPNAEGRLQVRFDWSNQGDGSRFNECWIAVDPALIEKQPLWWGGMEVVVRFRKGDPGKPYISDRLWDPDINPETEPGVDAPARRVITTRIDRALFLDESQAFSVDDQFIVKMAQDHEMHFRVGNSQVTIDSRYVSLSGLRIMLSSIAEAEQAF